jgi:3'-phosphoadenosine 5'-phosphosulfate sulfotransferase (PAPS reductase)/FAD synthetase
LLKEKYSFKEIIEAQKRPLEEKISLSVEVLRKAYKLSRHNVAIAFSGGKDSTVVADLIERFLPEEFSRTFCIFGNTGVEFPESLKFARSYGNNHFGVRFKETKPLELQEPELRYNFAREIVNQLEKENALDEVLKSDGKLKSQKALINAAKRRGYVLDRSNCFKVGTKMTFAYCLEQYGAPLLGKSASKLDAHRINIECFLKYSDTASEKDELKEYYDTLRECKYSQHCCTLLKKKPSEKIQAELDCDVIIKGLMAAESHTRMVNVATRGHIFASSRPHIKDGAFYHVSPIAMWTDDDIWDYIHKYAVEYSSLYDITYTDKDGEEKHIKRNGCMFCGTDIQFKDNHLSVLRQTHPKAYRVCMEQYGYKHELNKLFDLKKNPNILAATTDLGRTARMIAVAGEQQTLLDIRPCAYDDFAEMVDLKGTGLDNEYDPDV